LYGDSSPLFILREACEVIKKGIHIFRDRMPFTLFIGHSLSSGQSDQFLVLINFSLVAGFFLFSSAIVI